MTKEKTEGTAAPSTGTELATQGTTSLTDGRSLIESLRRENQERAVAKIKDILVTDEEFFPALVAKGEAGKEAALKYLGLVDKMKRRADDGTEWSPPRIDITKKKSTRHEDVYNELGDGALYNAVTKKGFDKDLKFFPLYYSTEHKLFKDGVAIACDSIDGKKGIVKVEINGAKPGAVHVCGSSGCPNPGYVDKENSFTKMPKPFQKNVPQSACQFGQALYLVDQDFQNIYILPLRNQGISMTLKPMQNALKNEDHGIKFDATLEGATWWRLGTEKVEFNTPNGKNSTHYPKALKTDFNITSEMAQVLLRLALVMETRYIPELLKRRDERDSNAAQDLQDLETSAAAAQTMDAAFETA